MFIEILAMLLVSFGCGVVVGILTKGININVNHKQTPEAPKEYNKAVTSNLSSDMIQYAHEHQGQIKF